MRFLVLLLSLPLFAQSPGILSPARDSIYNLLTPVFLSAAPTGDTYVWRFSNGDPDLTGASAIYQPTALAEIRVSLYTVAEDGAETFVDDRILYPYSPEPEELAFFPDILKVTTTPNVAAVGETVTLSAEIRDIDNNGPHEYLWSWLEDGKIRRASGNNVGVQFGVADTVTVALVVRDLAQSIDFDSGFVTVASGNLPPSVAITEPDINLSTVPLNTPITFRAETSDRDGDPVTLNWFLPDGSSSNASSLAYTFTEEGFYVVTVQASDGQGGFTLASIQVQAVALEGFSPSASIFYPSFDARIFEGDSLMIYSNLFDQGTPTWEIRNEVTGQTETFQQADLGRYRFSTAGLYRLTYKRELFGLTSQTDAGNVRWVAVHRRDANQPPVAAYEEGQGNFFVVEAGAEARFSLDISDPDGDPLTYFWRVDGQVDDTNSAEFVTRFFPEESRFVENVAIFSVSAQAMDDQNKAMSQASGFTVYAYRGDVPPQARINGLIAGSHRFYAAGEPIDLEAVVENPADVPLSYSWRAILFSGGDLDIPWTDNVADPEPFVLTKPGRYLIYLGLNDDNENNGIAASLFVHIYDPEQKPVIQLIEPANGTVRTEVGVPARIESFIADPNYLPYPFGLGPPDGLVTNQLEVSVDGGVATVSGFRADVSFDAPGTYPVMLRPTNNLGIEGDPLTVNVVVGAASGDQSEPNDTRDQAVALDLGYHGGFSLSEGDPVDWYRFTLPEEGSLLTLELDLTDGGDDLALAVYQGDRLVTDTVLEAGRRHPFRYLGGEAGAYFLEMRLVDPQQAKTGLSFNFGVTVKVPTLTFPHVRNDSVEQTILTLVNPTGEPAQITIAAYRSEGVLLDKVDLTIEGYRQMESPLDQIFPDAYLPDMSWVSVLSDRDLKGMTTTLARDGRTAVAEWGSPAALEELVVPHIAQRTDQWWTQAALANPIGEAVTTNFQALAGDYAVSELNKVDAGATLDFETFFGGSLPQGSEWGTFYETNNQAALAGVELFGTRQGSPRQAALRLTSERFVNPNFTYVNRDIVFPHVAADQASFWTALAFVNTGSQVEPVRLVGYDGSGVELASESIELQPGEKRVGLARGLFSALDNSAPLSWVKLESTGPVSGYELFGDNTGNDTRIAGLSAVRGASREVFFLRFNKTGWNGISAVNLSDSETAALTYEVYSQDGTLMRTVTGRTIGPRQKDVLAVESLLGGPMPANIGWIKLSATQPLAAFQLFGDLAGNFMAATTAQ